MGTRHNENIHSTSHYSRINILHNTSYQGCTTVLGMQRNYAKGRLYEGSLVESIRVLILLQANTRNMGRPQKVFRKERKKEKDSFLQGVPDQHAAQQIINGDQQQ